MPELLFYQKPTPLDARLHRELRLTAQATHYGFAAATNSVVLTGVEFIEAAKEYPIVFAKVGDKVVPVAVLGVRDAENLFVKPDGGWNARYIPAFVRRYPFVLAGSEAAQQLTVCFDAEFPGFVSSGTEGQPLFDEQGQPTPWLNQAIRFLQEYQAQVRRTETFVNRLTGLDLLVERSVRVEFPNSIQRSLQGLLAVDEQKLLALSKPQALELFRCGELSWVYAHLASLSNMGRLVDLMAGRT
ncbi:MAG: SapC family protein [Magnetococcales bacterium]|nr:SapC family protein [Magnetococcales bacterium]